MRIDVLIGNKRALKFWKAVGFINYCITMEAGRWKVYGLGKNGLIFALWETISNDSAESFAEAIWCRCADMYWRATSLISELRPLVSPGFRAGFIFAASDWLSMQARIPTTQHRMRCYSSVATGRVLKMQNLIGSMSRGGSHWRPIAEKIVQLRKCECIKKIYNSRTETRC